MDLSNQISSVVNLSDYIELTQDVLNRHKNVKIAFNMSTILSLKKIRSLEIEHFNKCDGNGAAFKLFERMLSCPPSKTWGLLGAEVVGLIQYWLDAVRKHLISHHIHWWVFMKQLLSFVKKFREKDYCLSSLLVEEIAEPMLELATSGRLDVHQRYEILHTFNLFCAESSRDIRLALRTQLEPHFVRLATLLATCAHAPAQLAALEALLRWLVPRAAPPVRRAAAQRWLLPHLYAAPAVQVFLQRNWMNFFQDARDFLNTHNESKDLVVSVICRKLIVGEVVIISGEERRQSWLDINTSSHCVTVVLEPRLLEALGLRDAVSCETLCIARDYVSLVKLYRDSSEVRISVETLEAPSILPSQVQVFTPQPAVGITLSSRSDLPRVDTALRAAFGDKYQDENSRFSHPVKEKRRKPQAGYVAWSKKFASLKSPSTASTASLAQLHDKLANLPYTEFTKEPVSVCAQPELSIVDEVNESQISNSLGSNSTFVLRRCAARNFRVHAKDRKSQSDSETVKARDRSEETDNLNNTEAPKGSQSDKYVNKNKTDEREVSSLFAATIGSADNSIINATIERLPKDKEINTDNLIDLLVQEALQSKANEDKELSDSGINTEDGKKSQNNQDSETIEDTQYTGPMNTRAKTSGLKNIKSKTSQNKVVSKSTSDESNTEAINDTPVSFVNVRKRNQRKLSINKKELDKPEENAAFDVGAVEDFFSQHFAENQMGDVIISPTLAKKINESSSESSNEFLNKNIDDNFDIRNEVMPKLNIVECLNNMVDKVCSDFDKCTEYLDKQSSETEILNMAKSSITGTNENIPLQVKDTSVDEEIVNQNQELPKNTKAKGKQAIKLKFTSKKTKAKPKAKGKLKLEPVTKMSIILENNESDANKTSSSDTKKVSNESTKITPIARRKRKLYSPKDDQIQFEKSNNEALSSKPDPVSSDNDDDVALAEFKKEKLVTPKSVASCYKEIEKERKHFKRTRAQKFKKIESPPSPKTKRLDDVFEKLKDNIEVHENENIMIADKKSDKDLAIFNFTSDSEDEDFKHKKIEVQKRTSTTTIGSGTSVISTRRGRAKNKVKYTESEKESPTETSKPAKRKRATRRKVTKTKAGKSPEIKVDRPTDLVDEKMREAVPEEFNASFVAANVVDIQEPEPMIKAPELEVISDENANIDSEDCKKVANKAKKQNNKKAIKVEKHCVKKPGNVKLTKETKKSSEMNDVDKNQDEIVLHDAIRDDDGTISPLPGLVIETEPKSNEVEDSLTTNLANKFQKLYKDGPDAYNDTITTQNMLSDNEKAISPHMNITDELGRIFGDDNSTNSKNKMSDKSNEDKENNDINIINDTINSDHMSKISKTESTKRNKLRLKCKDKTDSSVNSNSVKEDTTIKTTKDKTENQHVLNDSQKSKAKSIISQINEIICIDTEILTKTEAVKTQSKNKETEIISITLESEENSERSIATDGITGHGDMDEPPPSSKLLREKLTPREIQDMNETIKEYYMELSRKANTSKDSTESRSNANVKIKDDMVKNQVMQRAVEEDNASEPRSVVYKSDTMKRQKLFEDRDYDIEKLLPSRRETESESSSQGSRGSRMAPSVSITRLSSKQIAKWLPSVTPNSSFKSAQKSQETSKSIRTVNDITKTATQESVFELVKKRHDTVDKIPKAKANRKSQISPINLDDFMPNQKILRKDVSRFENETTINTQDIEIFKLDSIAKKYFLRPTHESSPIERDEISEVSTPKTSTKRKTPVTRYTDVKRRRHDEDRIETAVDISESRQSSNVEDWLKNISAISRVDNIDASSDVLQNLMEKLDTTLAEIHQNTTKDFINLFVEAQQQLSALKEERRRCYRRAARDILSDVAKLIDQQFAHMDERAEERSDSFMSWLRSRAGSLLRRDCSQKRALVALLREDAQAVADHLASQH